MQRLRGLSKKLPQVNKGGNGSTSAPPKQFEPPKETPIEKITMEDLGESLKMCRVDKGGYLTTVPDEKVGHFYAGDSYVLFCKYKVRLESILVAFHATIQVQNVSFDVILRHIIYVLK